MKNKKTGFTIVELLIVIVIVGILVTITVAAYSGLQNRSRDSEKQTDIRNLAQQLELYYQEKGTYPSFAQLTNSSWRATNIPNTKDALITPPGTSSVSHANVKTPSSTQYGYHNEGTCVGSTCTKFHLYWRSDITGSIEVYTGSTG